jgi:hypothetical protein
MYALVEDNNITKLINNPKSMVIGDVRYPAKIFQLLDKDGNQVINYGLKTEKKRIVKDQASGLLAPTDWYVIKATEVADYSVPSNITTFRADVRTKSNEMETAIDNASDVDALKALYEYTNTGTEENPIFTRPLGEFPTLEN